MHIISMDGYFDIEGLSELLLGRSIQHTDLTIVSVDSSKSFNYTSRIPYPSGRHIGHPADKDNCRSDEG